MRRSRACRTDDNQSDVVKALEAIGCSVRDASRMGDGFPDLIVGYRRRNFLLEVKDGAKAASDRKLTPDQVEFHRLWRGQVAVVTSAAEAIECVLRMTRDELPFRGTVS